MTRINTNVSSLNAQKTLARSNAQLQQAMTRLSTGLRINTGKDDPAGLIASEMLRSNIVSTQRAVSNSERANQMIATADSALGQVSSLLNDIRALVSEGANTGAMSEAQVAANQLQIDASLDAIDRIAQVTQFQGRRLLDGSLDFVTRGVSNTQMTDLNIEQANFGTLSEIGVAVDVTAQAEKGELQYAANTVTDTDGVVLEVGGNQGFQAFKFAYGSSVALMADAINLVSDALGVQAVVGQVRAETAGTGTMNATSWVADADVAIAAAAEGRDNGNIAVKFVKGADGATSAIGYTRVADGTDKAVVTLGTTGWLQAEAATLAVGDVADTITLTARFAGEEFNGVTLEIDTIAAGVEYAYYDYANKRIHVGLVTGNETVADLVAIFSNDAYASVSRLFSAVADVADADDAVVGVYGPTITGADGGVLADDATAIAALIGTGDSAGYLALSTSTGAGIVQAFEMATYYGSANLGRPTDANNMIQFLGPDGLRNIPITFAKAAAGEPLSVTLDQKLGFNGKSKLVFQGAAANSSFQIEAKEAGAQWNGVSLAIVDVNAGEQFVTYDAETKRITLGLELDTDTVETALNVINNNPLVSKLFTATALGSQAGVMVAGTAGVYAETSTGGEQPYTGLTVHLATDASGRVTTTAADLVTFAQTGSNPFTQLGISLSHAGGSNGSGLLAPTASKLQFTSNGEVLLNRYAQGTTYNRGGENARMLVRALNPGGTYDDVRIVFADSLAPGDAANVTYAYNATDKTLTIGIASGTTTLAQALARFTPTNYATEFALFNISAVNGTGGTLYASDFGTLSGGVINTGESNGAVLLGNHDIGDYIGDDGLRFLSAGYGSKQFVSVKALSGDFVVTNVGGTVVDRDYGEDVQARINGIQAIGDGLKAAIKTSVLDMNFSLSPAVEAGARIEFTIESGGAQFQLGPEVVSNQQARMGITSVNTVKLGGTSGRLYQLRSGESFALETDVIGAARVVNEVITQVTSLRGRLGAFQRTTLQTNIDSLNDTLEALVDAESSIRDADFAAESASLTRAQILVQSGVTVLSIANSNPQNVLALLR